MGGIVRSDDSGEYFSEYTRKVVKLETLKLLVIVMGGNLAEIRPLGTDARKWKNLKKMGHIGSGDSGKYFSKMT